MESIKTKHIIEQLKIKLKEVLPGDTPRNLFAPVINGKKQERSNPTKTTRKASVLLLLWERNEKLQVVFTLRSSDLLSHSGQISFPGGEAMPNETSIETALRETFEEIGVPNFRLEILGQLSPIYIMPSDFYIQPIVAYSKDYLDFKINKDE
jgi:8-oxo-dGTP pyrophosphatase MutT (NUDIX family)